VAAARGGVQAPGGGGRAVLHGCCRHMRALVEHTTRVLAGGPRAPALGAAGEAPSHMRALVEHTTRVLAGGPRAPALGAAGEAPSHVRALVEHTTRVLAGGPRAPALGAAGEAPSHGPGLQFAVGVKVTFSSTLTAVLFGRARVACVDLLSKSTAELMY
jgi:hypothetical protein